MSLGGNFRYFDYRFGYAILMFSATNNFFYLIYIVCTYFRIADSCDFMPIIQAIFSQFIVSICLSRSFLHLTEGGSLQNWA